MAQIRPLRALHYDLGAVGGLENVVAPPYDVIDPEQRASLAARSPYNVVAIDLPTRAKDAAVDPYQAAGELFVSWQQQGILRRDSEPALWAHAQEYTGPDGIRRTRRGFFCDVRIEDYGPGRIRPHERTHPGPKEDRLRLTRATRCNLSPIFSLYSDPQAVAWEALSPFTARAPWGEVSDEDGTVHRTWRVTDAQAIESARRAVSRTELLIADGHHRYETAQAYAREMQQQGAARGGEGGAASDELRYVLMCLVALEDPGLTVFPTHRLVGTLGDERRAALRRTLERDFDVEEVSREHLTTGSPDGGDTLQLGFMDARERRPLLLTLKDQAIADTVLAGRSEAYRHLDTGVLEALLLKGPLQLTDNDISHLNGLGYARGAADALSLLDSGAYDVAFIMRPPPVAQVKDVAAAGENMPPKSTYFFPKLLTGLLFNPLY
jgi:uncharacterized protein (DUF1015 family)